MALKPRTITAPEEGDENPELVDMNRRFWVSVVLTVPLILIAMVHDLPGNPLAHLASPAALRWAELPLATPVVLHRGVRTMLFPSEDHRDSGGAEPRAGLYWHRSKEFMAASKPREYDVVVERDAEGFYVASVPALPGCHTQARSLDELMERIKEAIELWLEVEGDVGSGLDFVGVQRIRLAS
jgi:predicted RNase H-like HicB family nuclease